MGSLVSAASGADSGADSRTVSGVGCGATAVSTVTEGAGGRGAWAFSSATCGTDSGISTTWGAET